MTFQSNFSGECHADDKECKLTLPGGLPAGERCVQSLDGKLAYGSRLIALRETGPICAPVSTGESDEGFEPHMKAVRSTRSSRL